MQCDCFGSDRLQETKMDASKPFNSKYATLKIRGGFFTKFAALAHGVRHLNWPYSASLLHFGSKIQSMYQRKDIES